MAEGTVSAATPSRKPAEQAELAPQNDDERMRTHLTRLQAAVDDNRATDADDARRDIAHLMARGVEMPVDAADVPAPPRGFYTQSSTYLVGERVIWASTQLRIVTSYTLDASAFSADGNGDKVAVEGLVLTWSTGGRAKAHVSAGTQAIGVLLERHNLRDSDQECGMVIGGYLNSTKLVDNGVFGTVLAASITDLAALGVFLVATDI